jgi:hypothetical protein
MPCRTRWQHHAELYLGKRLESGEYRILLSSLSSYHLSTVADNSLQLLLTGTLSFLRDAVPFGSVDVSM